MSRFLIEAMIQVTAGVPYTKISFISNNEALEYHRRGLQAVYHEVLSIKAIPADDALLLEYGDTQGNTAHVNEADVLFEPTEDISDTHSESGPTAA